MLHPFCVMQEFKVCNLEACPEVRRNTPWTPWMPVNVSQNGSRQEQRFRHTCRALLPDPQQLQLGKKKVETRFCPSDRSGACQTDCEYSHSAAWLAKTQLLPRFPLFVTSRLFLMMSGHWALKSKRCFNCAFRFLIKTKTFHFS